MNPTRFNGSTLAIEVPEPAAANKSQRVKFFEGSDAVQPWDSNHL